MPTIVFRNIHRYLTTQPRRQATTTQLAAAFNKPRNTIATLLRYHVKTKRLSQPRKPTIGRKAKDGIWKLT